MSASDFTKYMIAEGTKTLLLNREFHEITVSDIAKQCEINRNTFYYHFKDKYDVVDWIFYSESKSIQDKMKDFNYFSDGLLELLRYMKKNRAFYIKVLRDEGQNCFSQTFTKFIVRLIKGYLERLDANHNVEEEVIMTISHFYAYGFTGVILEWANAGMKTDPERKINLIKNLFYSKIKVYFNTKKETPDMLS